MVKSRGSRRGGMVRDEEEATARWSLCLKRWLSIFFLFRCFFKILADHAQSRLSAKLFLVLAATDVAAPLSNNPCNKPA